MSFPPFKPVPAVGVFPPGTAGRMLQVMASQIGYREGTNNATAAGDWYPMQNQPWCAMQISWAAEKAGVPTTVIPKHAYTPSGADWFKARGQLMSTPQAGDVGYVYYASKGRIGHVFLVEMIEGNTFTTIEGNTNDTGSSAGNGVYRLRRSDTSNLSYGRPKYVATSAPTPEPPIEEDDDMQLKPIRVAIGADPKKLFPQVYAYAGDRLLHVTGQASLNGLAATSILEWTATSTRVCTIAQFDASVAQLKEWGMSVTCPCSEPDCRLENQA